MEAARNFVAKHTSRKGHTTDVEEIVNPAVVWEQIHPTRHEIVTEALDKEVHQHHYHTTVQPLNHTVTAPTKHSHILIPAKHTTHQKDDVEATKARVAADAAQFKNVSITLPTTHSTKKMPTVIGTHYHHHVHETVQPVIHKEVITSEIVHTTVPIHEHHHNKSEHHTMSALPLKTMAEFKSLQAAPKSVLRYEGAPRPYESALETTFEKLGLAKVSSHKTHALETTPSKRPSTSKSRSSSSSASSLSSLDDPRTPTRSPRTPSKHAHNQNTIPIKSAEANKPVRIIDADSPRLSNDSTTSGHHGFMSRLTGRA